MIILKGYEHSKGEMSTGVKMVDRNTGEVEEEKISYDNYNLHFVSNERQGVVGWYCDNVKAAVDTLQLIGGKTLADFVDKQVIFGFDMTAKPDRNGRVRPAVTSIVLVGDVK